MGFRKDAWATCWSAEPKSDTMTLVRISTSRKDSRTGEYVQDFSGYVAFVGTVAAKQAASLKVKDRIQLGDVEVTTNYVKERNQTYTNFKCYNFTISNESQSSSIGAEPQPAVDEGVDDDRLPF